jgi:hypothetical protein
VVTGDRIELSFAVLGKAREGGKLGWVPHWGTVTEMDSAGFTTKLDGQALPIRTLFEDSLVRRWRVLTTLELIADAAR